MAPTGKRTPTPAPEVTTDQTGDGQTVAVPGVVVTDAPDAGKGQAINVDTGQMVDPGDPLPEAVELHTETDQARIDARRAEGYKALGLTEDGKPLPAKDDPPVYDDRGNVRPRGTEGARPMTKAERKAIAASLRDEADKAADVASGAEGKARSDFLQDAVDRATGRR